MASYTRVTGVVLKHEQRAGTSTRTGNPYDFHTYNVLVGDYGTTEVRVRGGDIASAFGGEVFRKGDPVDFVCEVDVYNGAVNINAVGVFDPASMIQLV